MKLLKQASVLLISILLSYCTQKTIPYTYHTSDVAQPEVEEKSVVAEETPEDIFADFSADSIKVYVKAS